MGAFFYFFQGLGGAGAVKGRLCHPSASIFGGSKNESIFKESLGRSKINGCSALGRFGDQKDAPGIRQRCPFWLAGSLGWPRVRAVNSIN